MEQQREPPPIWSSVPQEILIDIFSRHGEDFLFRLAVMGVCKHWRECSRWVDSLVFRYSTFKNEHCKVHQAPLDQCGCIGVALSSTFGSSYALATLVLQEDVDVSLGIWSLLQECDFTHLHGKLETLSLWIWCNIPDEVELAISKILHNILRCTSISSLEIELGLGSSRPDLPGVDLSQARELNKSLRVCKLIHVNLTDTAIRTLVDLCRALEHLEISHSNGMQDPVLDAPNLVNLVFTASCETLTLDAPMLEDLYVDGAHEVITEGTCLQFLALASPVALTFTGMIELEFLHILGPYWTMECIMECLRSVSKIRSLNVAPDFSANEGDEEESTCFSIFFQGLDELEELEINVDFIKALHFDWELGEDFFKSLEKATVYVEELCSLDEEEDVPVIMGIWHFFFQCPADSRRVLAGNSIAFREKINAKVLEQERAYYSDPEYDGMLIEID